MRITRKLVDANPDDPMRCQASGSGGEGQCRFLSVDGLIRDGWIEEPIKIDRPIRNCPKHGGLSVFKQEEKKRVHDYRLQVWQERIHEFSESDKIKSLRGEIAILRMLAETLLAQCHTNHDLMMFSGKISDLMMKIEKLVRSCDRLESSMGMLMDRSTALVLAGRIVDIISEHVKEPEIVDAISNGIITAISEVT